MTVLRNIEQKIEALFEGVFGRAFRTHVQPVELARKLAKEMDDHRMVSVSRVYAPNEYSVYLSPQDREQFSSYEESLVSELQDYLGEHAKRESYVLLSSPNVLITRLRPRGRRIRDRDAHGAARAGRGARRRPRARAGSRARRWSTGPQAPRPRPRRRRSSESSRRSSRSTQTERSTDRQGQRRHRPLEGLRHPPRRPERLPEARGGAPARARPTGSSTSDRRTASTVNGRRQQRAKLKNDDRITVGSTELVFRRSA